MSSSQNIKNGGRFDNTEQLDRKKPGGLDDVECGKALGICACVRHCRVENDVEYIEYEKCA